LVDCIADRKSGDITKSLSLVTFNYDRSLPFFLFTSLKSRFNLSDEEAARRLAVIPIVHVYGHVGLLPWQPRVREKDPVWDYGYTAQGNELRIAAEGIHTNGGEGSDEPKKASDLIAAAQHVFVLGFGFQDDNCELIGLKSSSVNSPKITRFGLSKAMLQLKAQRYNLTWEDRESRHDIARGTLPPLWTARHHFLKPPSYNHQIVKHPLPCGLPLSCPTSPTGATIGLAHRRPVTKNTRHRDRPGSRAYRPHRASILFGQFRLLALRPRCQGEP
jgi:hypothetical protein